MRYFKWVYQERESDAPWALYLEREWMHHKPRDAIYTIRLFSEKAPNSDHCTQLKYSGMTVDKALEWMESELVSFYGEADKSDLWQIERELTKFFRR